MKPPSTTLEMGMLTLTPLMWWYETTLEMGMLTFTPLMWWYETTIYHT
jgi:hypothetical protein